MSILAVNPSVQTEFPLSPAIRDHHFIDEDTLLRRFLMHPAARLPAGQEAASLTRTLIDAIRKAPQSLRIESLLKEYSLSTQEGVTLMCLAEALLRIPDDVTAEAFVQDRLTHGDWAEHLGHSEAFWVNASTWGLLLAGKLFKPPHSGQGDTLGRLFSQLFHKIGEPLALGAIRQAMAVIGHQFVAGETIVEAQAHASSEIKRGYSHSFDMLGEAALTHTDVQRYVYAYSGAIDALETRAKENDAALSVKLSAFHPRFEPRQTQSLQELRDNLLPVLLKARNAGIAVTFDAEESWRLEATLEIFADMIARPEFRDWGKLGIAVQAYQKRALPVLHWLANISRRLNCHIPVRLVKGAYWDSEIKWAQQHGLSAYPVFTRKEGTDLSYQICARYLLAEDHLLLPQFATHNAQTVASILTLAKCHDDRLWEFQRLHGMGEALHDQVLQQPGTRCRIYAPVGSFRELLPYLVRRLLENGANTSFVRQVHLDDAIVLTQDPATRLRLHKTLHDDRIPLPSALFSPLRRNSTGIAIEDHATREQLQSRLQHWLQYCWHPEDDHPVYGPMYPGQIIGFRRVCGEAECHHAISAASSAHQTWQQTTVESRARILEGIARLFEENRHELIALLIREAGKTITNAIAEWREAVDYCRYYATQARSTLSPQPLPGPTGESNVLYMEGRGVFLCISPWNFPLAILTGQVVAALVAGNCVLAKCSLSTPLIARRAIALMHEAGIPHEVLHYLPAPAALLEGTLLSHPALAGVMFTGSHAIARRLQRNLARRDGALLPLIAETGGINAMIVDSTALPEQVVKDVAVSAFDSAGQRCSALRVLYLQEDIADHVTALLSGHLSTLRIGDPCSFDTDIGPVIDAAAQASLLNHIATFRDKGRLLYQASAPAGNGHFVLPTVLALHDMSELEEEIFGPVLHVIRYKADAIADVIRQIRNSGHGLTFGIHTRIESRWQQLCKDIPAGNIYINRSMIGATVGVQPFGGRGLSGTGPKAGGPHYLLRLVHEKTVSHNTAAIGGNVGLLAGK